MNSAMVPPRRMVWCTQLFLVLSQLYAVSLTNAGELGANKFDLALQYVNPSIPASANAAGYRLVRRSMAKKAIADARDTGLQFLRVAVTGYWPDNLAPWQEDPAQYWAAVDQMFDDLDRVQIRLVPTFLWLISQFADSRGDTLETFVTDAGSASRQLLARYVREFITRYRERQTILFYELTNEMNLEADLDLDSMRLCEKDSPGPCVHGHFSTEQMDRFADDLASLIRSLDPSRPVSSGYSIPRPAAAHLVRKPGFASGGPDFTPDTPDEFAQYLTAVHKPFQIISIHVYPNMEPGRFGRQSGEEAKLVADAAAAARTAGKPLFLGEFGDKGATPFMTALLDEIVRSRVEYAAVWIWEFYQTSTYRTHDTEPTKYSLEPGYPNGVIPLLMRTEGELGVPPPTTTDALPRVVLTWPLPCGVIEAPVELHAVARSPAVLTGPSHLRIKKLPML